MDAVDRKIKQLEETLDQLDDDSQFRLLYVLEALNFAQNAKEALIEDTQEVLSGYRHFR
jgi:hypothetical protein